MKKSKLINQLISRPNTPINTPTQNQFTNCELEQIDKQAVEEMAKVVKSSLDGLGCGNFNFTGDEISTMFAKALYNAGYRKQSVGEWVDQYQGMYENQLYKCSVCGETAFHDDKRWFLTNFCSNCGAKMKGGAEG